MQKAWTRWLTRLLLLAVFALVPALAAAQSGKVQGVVRDAESGQPIDGAQVLLAGTGIGALTDENGRYFMLNIPPGTYTVIARRIGFQTQGRSNVQVVIDVTRTVDFQLQAAAQVIEEIQVTVATTPLVEAGVTGSGTAINAQEIEALPVLNIQGVLQLQQGFMQVPQNTDILSFSDSRRNPATPVRIRGGRGGETLTLIDLVPVNNFVFGGPAFDLTTEAIEQVDFQRGGFEPQYGNALSGIINIATREGGTSLAGAVDYQTSAVGGALGSTSDDLLNFSQLEGFVSGPVPGTGERLRFLLAGRNQSGSDAVLEFDNDVFSFSNPPTGSNQPLARDLISGWRAFGYDNERDVFGKLTLLVTPRAKLSASWANYQRQRLPFDFDWIENGFNALETPAVTNLVDSLGVSANDALGTTDYMDVVQGSIRVDRDYYALRWDHTFGRWVYKIAVGRFNQQRNSCSVFQGVCLGDRFSDLNFDEQFARQGITLSHPARGSDIYYGGERVRTSSARGDVQSQLTDHHNIQFGAFYQRHDIDYLEWVNFGVNDVRVVPQFYRAEPWDAALYVQDRIEYDFLTVKLGARFDYGRAGGVFFANPRDPTNGTTARQVCEGQVFVSQPFDDPASGLSGFDACAKNRTLLDSAAAIAQQDDFAETSRRRQFSPRIGVSFPLSGNSAMFFNFGRFSQNPLYNNVFQNTGIGSVAGPTDAMCDSTATKPGTDECYPIIFSNAFTVPFLGNPNLLIEQTTSYEVGYAAEFKRNYMLSLILFSKDQSGLTGIRNGGRDSLGNRIFDVGSTYGTGVLDYSVLVNQDFQTVRGFEVQVRRRLSNYWGFNINYQYSQTTTNAAPPDVEFENTQAGDPTSIQEIRSEVDQAHAFNATLQLRVGSEAPDVPLGSLLRNGSASLTFRAASGLPYTPTLSFAGTFDNQVERNSGTAPATWQVDVYASKSWNLGALRYGAFLNVANLFDVKNCIQVFASTGRCTNGTVDQSRRENGNTVGGTASSTFFDRAGYIGQRRRINAGLRVSF